MKRLVVGTIALSLLFSQSLMTVDAAEKSKNKAPQKKAPLVDKDKNGIPDDWQKKYRLGYGKSVASKDNDRDGLTNLQEYQLSLNPTSKDTDKDKIPDGQEDKDKDKLDNAVEFDLGYNPTKKDSDNDGLQDSKEDIDKDGVINEKEIEKLFIKVKKQKNQQFTLHSKISKKGSKIEIRDSIGINDSKTIMDRLTITPNMTDKELITEVTKALGISSYEDLQVDVEFVNGKKLKAKEKNKKDSHDKNGTEDDDDQDVNNQGTDDDQDDDQNEDEQD